MNSGDLLTVKVRSRRGTERELKWNIGSRQEVSYEVRDLEQITAQQRGRRAAWLKGEAQTTTDASLPVPSPGDNRTEDKGK